MARLVWFALGAAAGMAYASQLVHKERLDLPPGYEELQQQPEPQEQGQKADFKTKLADQIDLQADQIANMIDQRVMAFTERLHVKGHEVASKLRGQQGGMEAIGIPGAVTMYGEPYILENGFESISGIEPGLETSR
jgi:hypothetical protein